MRRLSRLVGIGGAHALASRSFHLTRISHPWLVSDGTTAAEGRAWMAYRAALIQQSPRAALDAFAAWFTNLVGLLERFIGNALVARLLHEISPEVFPRPVKEST